ncbi:MAG: hypothetical protein AABX35_03570 [Nanoarchaeota archaeon]
MVEFFIVKETKDLNSFLMPQSYRDIFMNFINKIKKDIANNLVLLILTGSGGRDKIIEGWSDLDVMIVLKDFSPDDAILIYNTAKIFSIKIGATVYSKSEFEAGLVDSKTVFNLELIRNGIIKPIILDNNLKFPFFSVSYRRELHKKLLPNMLHNLKRNLSFQDKLDMHTIAKEIDTIMKFILSIYDGRLVSGYKEVQADFYNIFIDCPKIPHVFELLEGFDKGEYHDRCWKFIDYLNKNIILHNLLTKT